MPRDNAKLDAAGLKVEYRAASDLKPYKRNSRTHSEAQVDQLVASMREFGWTNPLLIDEAGEIIAGHGRLLAANKLGIEQVPCIVLAGLSKEQRRALVIADNKLALNAGWDDELLASELKLIGDDGFDVGLLGFSDDEIASLFVTPTAGLTDPDDVPEAPKEPVTVLGDVWTLGKHRIVCGDSTDAGTVAKALNGVEPHLMVTDPPYGVNYNPNWRNEADRANGKPYGARAIGLVSNDDRADWREAYSLFPGDVAYVWHPPGARQVEFFESLVASGFEVRMQIIWAKSHFPIGRGNYHVQHEPCWYAVKKGKTAHWSGDRKQTTIWQIAKPAKSETGHSTQKPVECMKRPIENNSSPGQAVYEPFSGSGTTIIAAEMTGRCCHAIELNPAYVDVAILRWQKFTGFEAIHAETGETFNELKASRERKKEAA